MIEQKNHDALQGDTKVHLNDVFQARCSASELPVEDCIKFSRMRCPQVALFGSSIAGAQDKTRAVRMIS
jgi:hypothetical protein